MITIFCLKALEKFSVGFIEEQPLLFSNVRVFSWTPQKNKPEAATSATQKKGGILRVAT